MCTRETNNNKTARSEQQNQLITSHGESEGVESTAGAAMTLKAAVGFKSGLRKKEKPTAAPKTEQIKEIKESKDKDKENIKDKDTSNLQSTKEVPQSEKAEEFAAEVEATDKSAEPSSAPPSTLRDRLRNKAQEAAKERKDRRESLVKQTKEGLANLMKLGVDERTAPPSSVSDMWLGGKKVCKYHKIDSKSFIHK